MEVAISAVTGELVSRFISFLMNKYSSSLGHAQSVEEKMVVDRLQHLLMRASTIIEEADTRYITNSGMLMQLKMLSEAMYRGHRMLDQSRYRALQDGAGFSEPDTEVSPSTVVPSVKVLALRVNFGVLEEVKTMANILRCFPNVRKLHIESVLAADEPTGSHNANFWRELRPIECLKSRVRKIFIHEFRGEQSEMEFLGFVARSALKVRNLLFGVTKEIFASGPMVNEAISKVAALSRGSWNCDNCNVAVVRPNGWSFHRASDLSIKDPFH